MVLSKVMLALLVVLASMLFAEFKGLPPPQSFSFVRAFGF